MWQQIADWSRSRLGKSMWLTVAVVAMGATVWGTPSLGFIANEILATGRATRGIRQEVEINRNQDGSITPWQLELQVHGDTDYYVQHLTLAPGGYSGWHSHPGLLVGALKSGQIDFYDAKCRKRTVSAGQVFTENDNVHAIINTGAVNADLYITYLIKHGVARRLDEPAPPCSVETPIP